MRNIQPIEKRVAKSTKLLSVHSIFHTIQGEGPFCGTPAVFVRLAGCNLQCPACDTDYTSGRWAASPMSVLQHVRDFMESGLVVVTGGEPFRQDLREVLHLLVAAGFYVQIESNGTLEPPMIDFSVKTDNRKGVYLVVSPKTGKLHADIFGVACALKYVVEADSIRIEDGLPLKALDHTANPYPARPPIWWNRPVYLQPMDSKIGIENERNTQAAVKSCLKHGYILQLQVHKLIGVE